MEGASAVTRARAGAEALRQQRCEQAGAQVGRFSRGVGASHQGGTPQLQAVRHGARQQRVDQALGAYIPLPCAEVQLRRAPERHTLPPRGRGDSRIHASQGVEHGQDLLVQDSQAVF